MAATIKLAPDLTICLRPLNGEATDDLTPELTVKDRHLSREISLEPSRSIALFVDIGDYFDMRSAEGAMILVDIVPDMPASRGVRNRQAYWISKEAAEGTHEIKWFKMWKTKDLDPKDFVLGRRLVMPGYQRQCRHLNMLLCSTEIVCADGLCSRPSNSLHGFGLCGPLDGEPLLHPRQRHAREASG